LANTHYGKWVSPMTENGHSQIRNGHSRMPDFECPIVNARCKVFGLPDVKVSGIKMPVIRNGH
jgi:hypothetical protein